MSLTDAEILALVVPIVASVTVMLAAWLNVRAVVRQRQRMQKQRAQAHLDAGDDVLLEIEPDILMRAWSGDRPRYFARFGALKALVARCETAPRSNAAE